MMMMTRESTNTKLFRTTARDENENESKVGIKRTMPTPARVMVVSGDGKDGIFIRVRSIHMYTFVEFNENSCGARQI